MAKKRGKARWVPQDLVNPDRLVQLKVSLRDPRPMIWRRLLVRSDAPLGDLHEAIQVSFGWENCHLHEFRFGDQCFGPAEDDRIDCGDIASEDEVFVGEVFRAPKDRGVYTYDFGDDWEHDIRTEKVLVGPAAAEAVAAVLAEIKGKKARRPVALCLGGARACPPEDCGGPWAYADLLALLENPAGHEHDQRLEWMGWTPENPRPFDPEKFDAAAVNRVMAQWG